MKINVTEYKIYDGAIRWRIVISLKVIWRFFAIALTIYMTSYLMTMVMFTLYLTFYETFANQIKRQKFDLENEIQGQGGEKRDMCHSTDSVWFQSGEFVFEF